MENLMNASVYVGTYGKYNSGSIAGKWINVSLHESKDKFIEACKKLHNDEYNPEFMFQDYENIPSSMVDESFISEEIWEVLAILKKYSKKKQESFCEWCESKGYEQDLQAIKEFKTIKFKRNYLPYELLLKKEYAKAWDSPEMQDYCMKETSNCIRTSFGGLVVFNKPTIETKFCFGYHHSSRDTESYDNANKMCSDFGEKNFIDKNLKKIKEILDLFEGKKKYDYEESKKLYFIKKYDNSNIYNFYLLDEHTANEWKLGKLIPATKEDFEKCFAAQKEEYEKFEKRIKSYLKRYGTKKLKKWTYWADA